MRPTNRGRVKRVPKVETTPEVKSGLELAVEDVTTMIATEELEAEEAKNEEPNAEVDNVELFLNIRSSAEVAKGNIITMLQKGTKIIVVDKKPIVNKDTEWYKVKVLDPVLEGYAMKKFIKVY